MNNQGGVYVKPYTWICDYFYIQYTDDYRTWRTNDFLITLGCSSVTVNLDPKWRQPTKYIQKYSELNDGVDQIWKDLSNKFSTSSSSICGLVGYELYEEDKVTPVDTSIV